MEKWICNICGVENEKDFCHECGSPKGFIIKKNFETTIPAFGGEVIEDYVLAYSKSKLNKYNIDICK